MLDAIISRIYCYIINTSSFKRIGLLFEEKGEKMANDSETQNLKVTQPLAIDEIKTFIDRIVATPVNDENTEELNALKKILDTKLGL